MPIYTDNPCDDGAVPFGLPLISSLGVNPKITKAIDAATRDWLDEHPEATTTVEDNSITNVKLMDGSVNSRTIEDGSIATDDIADLAVTTPKIADNAINADKIASSAVDGLRVMNAAQPGVAKVGAGLAINNGALELDGNGDIATAVSSWLDAHPEATTTVQDGSITTAKLADGTVTDAKLVQSGGVLEEIKYIYETIDTYHRSGSSYLTRTNYNVICLGITIKKDVKYTAKFELSQAFDGSVYAYITDENGNDLPVGSSGIMAGSTTKEFTFTLSANYENVVARLHIGSPAAPSVKCDFSIVATTNAINEILKITDNIKASSLSELKQLLLFAVGDLNADGSLGTFKKRISNYESVVFDEDVVVKMSNSYRCGYCNFGTVEQPISATWVGWATQLLIPKGTVFRLQLARPSDSGENITDPYDNDIYQNLSVFAIPIDDYEQYYNYYEYGHNGLKTEEFNNHALWTQGAATVGDLIVGFTASNDAHTNTATYDALHYVNGYQHVARGNHNLGHCASADYNSDTDTLIVANGTYEAGVDPTVYLVSGAKNLVQNGGDILVTDANVMSIPFTGCDGEGCVACFGETSDIIYMMTVEDALHYSGYSKKYLYKLVLGKGSVDMTSLYPNASFGTYVSGKEANEYNGTARILKEYLGDYYIELQGMKFINGRVVLSCDCVINGVLTAYLAYLKPSDKYDTFVIENAYWIPSLDSNGDYVATESEGVTFADGYGYITIYRNTLNDSKTLKFSLFS